MSAGIVRPRGRCAKLDPDGEMAGESVTKASIDKILASAERMCGQSGVRLTAKRRAVLATLLSQKQPLSAYELADQYRLNYGETIPAMSVYRMLDFLVEQNLAHKLSAINKYVPCTHISCSHEHEISQFLICDDCHRVSEIGVATETLESLGKKVAAAGFHLRNRQLELHGLCDDCYARSSAGTRPQ